MLTSLASLSRTIRRRTNARNFMFALSLFCLANVCMILLHNQLKALIPEKQSEGSKVHPALDYRQEGYTADDADFVLRSYGAQGRWTYAMFELVDLGAYMWSYAVVLSMMLSVGAAVAPFDWLKLVNVLPWAAAAADAAENSLMLCMLMTYPKYVGSLAPYAAAASAAKWKLLMATVSTVAGVGFYCLFSAAKQVLQPPRRSRQGQGQQQQRQQQQQQGKRTRKQQ